MSIWNREPVMILALVAAVINVLVVFGIDISTEMKTAILTVVDALLALAARGAVTPVADPKLPPAG